MTNVDTAAEMLDPLLRKEEGEELKPYLCTAGVPTIGVGATTYPDGRKVTLQDPPITTEQMDTMLATEIAHYLQVVLEMCGGVATAHQLVGLVLCGYNIGLPALRGSTMIKRHREGNYVAAARAFGLWDQAVDAKTGKRAHFPPLTARRAREAAIYLEPDTVAAQEAEAAAIPRPPQAVSGEASLAKSPVNLAGAATIGTGAMSLLTQAGDSADKAKTAFTQVQGVTTGIRGVLAEFDVTPLEVGGSLAIIAGAVVCWYRLQQRRQGWA